MNEHSKDTVLIKFFVIKLHCFKYYFNFIYIKNIYIVLKCT